eukprot:1973513-Amphidinium_carterae.1
MPAVGSSIGTLRWWSETEAFPVPNLHRASSIPRIPASVLFHTYIFLHFLVESGARRSATTQFRSCTTLHVSFALRGVMALDLMFVTGA